MLRFPVSPSKAEDLRRRMAALDVAESDLLERFFRPGSGTRGKRRAQVGVHLWHEASGVEVRCQDSTSQPLNRFRARRMLVRCLEARRDGGAPVPRPASSARLGGGETPEQHMQRMFLRSFERDVVQPYPLPSQKLLGAGSLPPKLIGILGEHDAAPSSFWSKKRARSGG